MKTKSKRKKSFQSTPPKREATARLQISIPGHGFNPRLPNGRQLGRRFHLQGIGVSIHASQTGGDGLTRTLQGRT